MYPFTIFREQNENMIPPLCVSTRKIGRKNRIVVNVPFLEKPASSNLNLYTNYFAE
jgi:hypothetical protein